MVLQRKTAAALLWCVRACVRVSVRKTAHGSFLALTTGQMRMYVRDVRTHIHVGVLASAVIGRFPRQVEDASSSSVRIVITQR